MDDDALMIAVRREVRRQVRTAFAAERVRRREVEQAERAIRPYLGDLHVACDSAEQVFRVALDRVQPEGPLN